MKRQEIHCCLDCDYMGRLVVIGGVSQCPACASRAVWPVSGWIKSPGQALFKLSQHACPAGQAGQPHCCDMTPSFFGGPCGYHE